MKFFYIAAFFTDNVAQPTETLPKLVINVATFLTVLCWAILAVFIVSLFIKPLKIRLVAILGDSVYFLAFAVPAVATFLSLVFSDYFGWTPCKLCWYQRAFMYPLAALMLIYYFKHTKILRYIGYFISLIGPIVSIYHVGVERGWFSESTSCNPKVPCAAPWFTSLNFLTTAGMAFTAFLTTAAMLFLSANLQNTNNSH